MKQRLSKVLAWAGVASRRKCEELIIEGHVKVNGKKVLIPQTLVDLDEDEIFCDKIQIKKEISKIYFAFNKPIGFECTHDLRRKSIYTFFQDIKTRLFSIGRLDKDTSGLMIVTNDGHFAHRVAHPSFEVEKEYLVKVNKEITHDDLVRLSCGAFIEHVFVRPKSVHKVRKGTLKITIVEGRKREVRHLMKEAGFEVISLKRIRIGDLFLGKLPEGARKSLQISDLGTLT